MRAFYSLFLVCMSSIDLPIICIGGVLVMQFAKLYQIWIFKWPVSWVLIVQLSFHLQGVSLKLLRYKMCIFKAIGQGLEIMLKLLDMGKIFTFRFPRPS